MIQDFPDNAKFLTEVERTFIIRRLQDDHQFSAAGENFHWKVSVDCHTLLPSDRTNVHWRAVCLDEPRRLEDMVREYVCLHPFRRSSCSEPLHAVFINASIAMPLYSFALFLPTIIEQLGKITCLKELAV